MTAQSGNRDRAGNTERRLRVIRGWMHRWSRCGWTTTTTLIHDRRGATAVLMALTLTAMVGLGGLATEAAGWYFTSRKMQSAADAAAYTAAVALADTESSTNFTNEAKWVAASAGYDFVDGSGSTVTVNNPPLSGSQTSNNAAVEVIISQPQTALLSSLFLSTGPTIAARSVAVANIGGGGGNGGGSGSGGQGCVLALDKGSVIGLDDSGNTTLNLSSCSIYVNSDDTSGALTMSGHVTINASGAFIVGGDTITGNATLNTNNNTQTGVRAVADPYQNVALPTRQTCDSTGVSLSGQQSQTLTPGTSRIYKICNGGLSLSGQSQLTLSPGIYIIAGGGNNAFSLSGGSTLSASGGVTIVLTNYNSGNNYATVSISGGATVNLVAPTSGPTAGMAFFQDRSAPSNGSDSFTGGSTQNVTGAIYFPDNNITFTGNSGTGGALCTQLIALTINFSGDSSFSNNCSSAGTTAFGLGSATFVE